MKQAIPAPMQHQYLPPATTANHAAMRPAAALAMTLALAGLLAGCGGGGGGEAGPTIDPVQLKGRWVTASGATPAVTAVVVPEASGTANAWLLNQDASRLVKLVVRSDSSANGKSYALSQGNAAGQPVTGEVSAALAASPKRISFTGVNTVALVLTQSDGLTPADVQADVGGTWNATFGGNAQTTQWIITSTGSTTGSSTTGCTYLGGVTAIESTAAYSVQVNESCPDGAKTAFGGIATLNRSKNGLTVVVVNADETRGMAAFFAK